MTAKGYLIVAGLLFAAGAWSGWAARGYGQHQVAQAALTAAATIDATATAAMTQGVSSAQVAQAQEPAIQAAHSKVDADRNRLQADERAAAGPVRPDSAGSAGPAAPVVESAVDMDKDRLITDLTVENGALRIQNTDLKAAVESLEQAANGFQREAAGLRLAVQRLGAAEHPWASGLIYGTSQTVGAFVERDFGPIRAGVDVVRRQLPAGNATADVQARLAWRF